MKTKLERLTEIQHYTTAYELIAFHTDGRKFLIGYIRRISRQGIIKAMQNASERILRIMQLADDDRMHWSGKGRLGHVVAMGQGWSVKFTGRTERDSIIEGELAKEPAAIAVA